MESIDRLRKYVGANTEKTSALTAYPKQYAVNCTTVINDLIDAVEQEVEQEVKKKYVELPKDANGEYIHIGDEMFQSDRITKRSCKAIMDSGYVMLDGIQGAVYAKGLTHYHELTVEDVLRDFAYCLGDGVTDKSLDEIVAEYAPKLQLQEEDQ